VTLVLRGATVIDGTGAEPLTGADVAVDGERISSVGRVASRGDEVIDVSGLTVLPGLIDAHVHLGLSTNIDATLRGDVSVAEMAAAMFDNCATTLDAGFTTVRDTGGIDAGLVGVVATGKVRGPRILCAGPVLCQTGGHGHFAPKWEPSCRWQDHDVPGLVGLSLLTDGVDDMRRNAREAFRRGADFLKLCVTGGVVSKHDKISDTQFSVEEIAAAVAEANARGTYVTVHAHNNVGVRNAITAGARCVEHGSELDAATVALMVEHDVALVPTLAVMHLLVTNPGPMGIPAEIAARVHQVEDQTLRAVRLAVEAGVRVGSGSDLIGAEQDRRGLELVLKSKLLDPMTALVCATRANADILGLADLGTLETGKMADLIAIDGDPLADPELFDRPERIPLVVKNGRIVKNTGWRSA